VNIRRLLAVVYCLAATGLPAQTADWTRVASTLDQLDAQVLDWSAEYARLAQGDDAAWAVADLHFRRGPVVASGMNGLLATWLTTAETQKKSRYLAVSRYFASHCDDWGASAAWAWYRCFAAPLDNRYNTLAADAGRRAVSAALEPSPSSDERRALVDRLLPAITAFLTAYGYPLVDTPITRFSFDGHGVLVDGRPPRDRTLLNKIFTYSGGLIPLFGPGF
jgi:hypothetical protein